MEIKFESRFNLVNNPSKIFECYVTDYINSPIGNVDPHWHNYFEVLLGIRGKLEVFIDNTKYIINKGDLIFINPKKIHSTFFDKNTRVTFNIVKFDPALFVDILKRFLPVRYILPFTMNSFNHRIFFNNGEIKGTKIPEIINNIISESEKANTGFELVIQNHICEMAVEIIRLLEKDGTFEGLEDVENKYSSEKLQSVFDYIHKNYSKKITVPQLAKIYNVSDNYFSMIFKKLTGVPITEYINYIRVNEAKKNLIDCEKNITDIAYSCGFSDLSYFIKAFKTETGLTPYKYRKELSKKH